MTQTSAEFIAENPISSLVGDERHQVRQRESQPDQDLLDQSVGQHGILVPLLLHQLPGGKLRPIDGHRRIRAAKANGLATVPGYVFPPEMPELECLSLALTSNSVRKDLTLVEKYQGVWRHHTEGGLTVAESARRCGLSQSAGTKILAAVQNNPEDVILEFTKQGGSYRALYKLTQCPTVGDKRALAKRYLSGELNVRQLEEEIDARFGKNKSGPLIKVVVQSEPTYESLLAEIDRLKKRIRQLQNTDIDPKSIASHLHAKKQEVA